MAAAAIALTNGFYDTPFAKTTHGLVRGPSRYPLVGVVDRNHAGKDAGSVLDNTPRGIPFFSSVSEALHHATVTHCIVGVATIGGVLPDSLRHDLEVAAQAGLTLVNGLHHLLSEDPLLAPVAEKHGAAIIDIRKPRPTSALRFWSGEVQSVDALRVAVLGMDCAIGKRTTAMRIREACRALGIASEMIYTGQTGWLQGLTHGFIFDSTINDFVSGELEGAVMRCYRDTQPDIILMEGQSSLRNPSGPAGSELILSGAAHGVILQHDPGRQFFEDYQTQKCFLPSIASEIALIEMMGCPVWAVTLYIRGLTPEQTKTHQQKLEDALGIPVVLPLESDIMRVARILSIQR